jgi:hypothetical protein
MPSSSVRRLITTEGSSSYVAGVGVNAAGSGVTTEQISAGFASGSLATQSSGPFAGTSLTVNSISQPAGSPPSSGSTNAELLAGAIAGAVVVLFLLITCAAAIVFFSKVREGCRIVHTLSRMLVNVSKYTLRVCDLQRSHNKAEFGADHAASTATQAPAAPAASAADVRVVVAQ